MSVAVPAPRRRPSATLGPILLGVGVLLIVLGALAIGRASAAEPASAPASMPAPVGLSAGEVAPFHGVLLPEARVLEVLDGKAALEECRLKVSVRDREVERLLAAAGPGPAPAVRWTFWTGLAVGLVGGAVLGGLVLYGASRLVAGGS